MSTADILEACEQGDLPRVRVLVDLGADVNGVGEHSGVGGGGSGGGDDAVVDTFPLYVAARRGDLKLVRWLVEEGNARVGQTKANGAFPLYIAAFYGHVGVVEYLVGVGGAHVDQSNNMGGTPLYVAAYHGHLPVVKYLVGVGGASVDQGDNVGATPLYVAAQNGHLAVVKFFVEEGGASVEQARRGGATPLYVAASKGHDSTVSYLLRAGADPTACSWAPTGEALACLLGVISESIHLGPLCRPADTRPPPLLSHDDNGIDDCKPLSTPLIASKVTALAQTMAFSPPSPSISYPSHALGHFARPLSNSQVATTSARMQWEAARTSQMSAVDGWHTIVSNVGGDERDRALSRVAEVCRVEMSALQRCIDCMEKEVEVMSSARTYTGSLGGEGSADERSVSMSDAFGDVARAHHAYESLLSERVGPALEEVMDALEEMEQARDALNGACEVALTTTIGEGEMDERVAELERLSVLAKDCENRASYFAHLVEVRRALEGGVMDAVAIAERNAEHAEAVMAEVEGLIAKTQGLIRRRKNRGQDAGVLETQLVALEEEREEAQRVEAAAHAELERVSSRLPPEAETLFSDLLEDARNRVCDETSVIDRIPGPPSTSNTGE